MGNKIELHSIEEYPELAVSREDMTYNKTGAWRVIRFTIDLTHCTRCLLCWKFCPDAAIEIVDGAPHINLEFCKGCGICAEECPCKCISFSQENK